MNNKLLGYKNYFIHLVCPAFVFGSITGLLTALVVAIYKFCAMHVIEFGKIGYEFLRGHLYLIPVVLAALFGISVLFAYLYKKIPNLQGGGIPTSIGILRGIIPFKWVRNLIGVFLMSMTSFLIGVPLDNEGPSMQLGTIIGRGSVSIFAKDQKAWDRYSMTGGACAGFSAATGAPITGIMFAIEEAHQSVSPMIIMVSATAVMFAQSAMHLLAPLFGISEHLFHEIELPSLELHDYWLPLVIGLGVGLFASLFLRYYTKLNAFFHKTLAKVDQKYKIFAVFAVTMVLGLFSYSFISTGHHLIEELFVGAPSVWMLLLILVLRSTTTLSANSSGITGGITLPIMALGATLAAIIAKLCISLGLSDDHYTIIVVLGIAACIGGMMKIPITAVLFSVEALSCFENIIPVIIAVTVSFVITEVFNAKSVNDSVLENLVEGINEGKNHIIVDTYVTVKPHTFAVGKQVRDIFWPSNLFVLSIKHTTSRNPHVDVHGGKVIREGDILHVRYSTFNEEVTKEELAAIVGEQDYDTSIECIE